METGLRHRLKRAVRQMSDQHRHLRVIQGALLEALNTGAPDVRQRFARYREAIEAHFALESETFFPAVHGLRAELGAALQALDRAHDELRARLARMERRVEDGPSEVALALGEFAGALRAHEAEEEKLLARVDEGALD